MNHKRAIKEMLSIPTGSRWLDSYHAKNNVRYGCCYQKVYQICVCVFCFVCFYFLNLVGPNHLTGMWLPVDTPVLQTLSFSLGLSFGLKILKAHLKI